MNNGQGVSFRHCINSEKADCLKGVKRNWLLLLLFSFFFLCGGTYRKWKPIDAHQRTSRAGGGEFRSKPDSVLGEYFLSGGIWATWRPTQAFIGGKNCMNALEKFSFFMKWSLFTAYFKLKWNLFHKNESCKNADMVLNLKLLMLTPVK